MLAQEDFFKQYKVQEEFERSELSWNDLDRIYMDYIGRMGELQKCKDLLEKQIRNHLVEDCHSICTRIKSPEHLIEKIIRKKGKEQNRKYENINETNYCEIIRDLIGVRILLLSKEGWERIFDWLTAEFEESSSKEITMAEAPVAYTRYGDRDIFKGKIRMEHTNKGYRSQHYILKYHGYYCEIQVRTLAEEVYGEFDHYVKYPYRENNKFLKRYTSAVSQLLDTVDEMISTCVQMGENGWDQSEKYYGEDQYIDWQHTSQKSMREDLIKPDYQYTGEEIDAVSYANAIFLRK